MSRYLNVAKAASLAGVSRHELQELIRQGELPTFEGQVAVESLVALYPAVQPEESAVLERVKRLQERAVQKFDVNHQPGEARLVDEVNRLRLALDDAEAEIAGYRELCMSLEQRLSGLQERCDHDQKLMVKALLRWMLKQMERRA